MSNTLSGLDLINESIQTNKDLYIETSQLIHANPEIGNQEFLQVKGM